MTVVGRRSLPTRTRQQPFALTPRRLLIVVTVLSTGRQRVVVIATATFLNHYVLEAGMQTSLENKDGKEDWRSQKFLSAQIFSL